MSSRSIRLILILGILTVAGMIGIQAYFVYLNTDIQKTEFNQKVMIGLRNVADSLAARSGKTLPGQDVVQRMSEYHYAVNINQVIDANLLEYYLFEEFRKRGLTYDFDYGIYDCFSDGFVFGNCCSFSGETDLVMASRSSLPRYENLNYYFVVSFPNKSPMTLFSGIPRLTWLFMIITLLAALFFIYAMSVILRQKRLSELQRDFINNMTHEFKTPISSIKLAADGLMAQPAIAGQPRLKHYLEIIREQNQRLNGQVEKVLNLAKGETDSFGLKKEPIDLRDFMQDLLAGFSHRIGEAGGALKIELGDQPFNISADRLHLMNVVDTILDNTLKYGGNPPAVRVGLDANKETVWLRISDQGIGMDRDELQKIFNKFYRVPTGDIHDVKGFGLGLYYVKKIVRAHHWNIEVESEKGKGSTFSIAIPLEKGKHNRKA